MFAKTNIIVAMAFVVCLSGSAAFAADDAYKAFYQRVLEDEAYIGFFAAEKKLISELTPEYEAARRAFFLGIDTCKDDPGEFVGPFLKSCFW